MSLSPGGGRVARRFAWAAALVALVGCQRRSAPAEGAVGGAAGSAAAATATVAGGPQERSGEAAGLHYVERQSGGGPDEVLPMVVAIHGLGDTPEHLGDALVSAIGRPVRVILPRGPRAYGGGYAWFDLGENAAMLAGLERSTSLVAGGLGELVRRRPTKGKPIVLGFSQGGMLSFALAAKHPSLVGAAFPVAGFLPAPLLPPKGSGPLPPVIAFHGADDPIIAARLSRESIEGLKAAGGRAEVRVYEGLGHQISSKLRTDLGRELSLALDAVGR